VIELRHRGTGSWLDPRSSRVLAAQLSNRLWERCRGHRGLVLTLTYRRDDYRDAQDLYRKQGEQQHVALFMRKIGRHLGESMTGRWFCKLEFQRAGWVHFHIILLDAPRVPAKDLARMWGHGFIKVRRLTPRAIRYCTKYLTKDDGVPAWLYGERPRSIKIIRVSRGFWGAGASSSPEPPDPGPPDDYDLYGPDRAGHQKHEGVYIPIGNRIEKNWNKFVARDERGAYTQGKADLGPLLVALLTMGCGVVGREGAWLIIDASLDDLNYAANLTARAAEGAGACYARPASAARGGGEAADLNLIQTSKPDVGRWPYWLDRWMWDHAVAEGGAA